MGIHTIDIISLNQDINLIPYQGREQDKHALYSLFNDPTVYPHIYNGKPWAWEKVEQSHRFLKSLHERLQKEGIEMLWQKKEMISLSWQLEFQGNCIGCGGLFWDPEDKYIPEIYLYIERQHQSSGVGIKALTAIMSYFKKHILPLNFQPLRILLQGSRNGQQYLAKKLGFYPVFDQEGKQLQTVQYDLPYLIFEKTFK